MQNSDRSVVLVMGPPRSGTSAVCHVLRNLGVDFGDSDLFIDPEKNRHNPIFFELVALNEINDNILAELGWGYKDFVATPLDEDFTPQLADKFEARIATFLESNFSDSRIIGLKDPRFCFTLPLWIMVMGRLGMRFQCILTQRDAEAVIASNFRLSPELGIDYSRRIVSMSEGAALHFLDGLRFQKVSFDELAAGGPQAIESLVAVSDHPVEVVVQAIAEVFDRKLVHWQGKPTSVPTPDLARDYAELARLIRKFEFPTGQGVGNGSPSAVPDSLRGNILDASFFLERQATFERGKVQLYFRAAAETYKEADSITLPWPSRASIESIEFELPLDAKVEYIRLDLNDFPGAYAVQKLLVDGDALAPLQHAIAGNGAVIELNHECVGLVANHDDPWLEFKVPSGNVRKVMVRVERLALATAGRKIFEDADWGTLLNGLQERISRIDDRVVGLREHTASIVATEVRSATEQLRGSLECGVDQQRASLEEVREAIALRISDASTAADNGLEEVREAIALRIADASTAADNGLDRTAVRIEAELSRTSNQILAVLEVIKARIFKRFFQGWFK